MTSVNPRCFHISASAVATFKACPTRFRLAYREGLRPAADTEAQRVGTNWHEMHEVYRKAVTAGGCICPPNGTDEMCPVCIADASPADVGREKVVELLDERYASIPSYMTPEEWALERHVLLTCFFGYLWYYQDDELEYLHHELPFNLPLHMPRTGLPLPMDEVQRVGKIDHIIRWHGMVGPIERKSTTRDIDPAAPFWERSAKDTQVSMYALAMRDMPREPEDAEIGARFGNTLYDVWRRPTIKPKALSQKDTAAFIQSGEYLGTRFEVVVTNQWTQVTPDPETGKEKSVQCAKLTIDGETVEAEPGAKGYAVRETIAMFGARLMADIQEQPAKYFQRQEIARTDRDLANFRRQLMANYNAQRHAADTGNWIENENACRATFPCSYIPICYGPGADAVCDGKTTPQGFKRIFVDLTVSAPTDEA